MTEETLTAVGLEKLAKEAGVTLDRSAFYGSRGRHSVLERPLSEVNDRPFFS